MLRSNSTRLALCLAAGLAICSAPARADDDRAYRAGVGLANKGMNEQAAAELRTYLDSSPDAQNAPNARYTLAVCLARLGKHADAAKELDRVTSIEGFPFAADALLLRGQCAMALGKFSDADAALSQLGKDHPDFARADAAAALRGEALYRAGDAAAARDLLSSFRDIWPKSPAADRAELFCAFADAALGDPKAAAERAESLLSRSNEGEYAADAALIAARCRQSLGDLEQAAALYDRAAKGGSRSTQEALLGSAQVARALGKTDQAERILKELASANLTPELLAGVALERGRVLLDQNKPDAALPIFRSLKEQAPALADSAAYWTAKCQVRQGRPAEAVAELTLAAETFPKSALLPDILFDRAAAIARAGDDAASLAAWSHWRSKFPKHELGLRATAEEAASLYRLGKHAESLAKCEEFAKASPKAADPTIAFLVAENLFLTGNFDAAEPAYARFAEKYPTDPSTSRAAIRRGLCLLKLDQDDEGERVLGAALSKTEATAADEPLRRAALWALGDRAFARKDWPASERWFGQLVKTNTTDSDALLRLALAVRRQGRTAEALPLLERAAAAGENSPAGVHASFERAQLLAEAGDLDTAREVFENVVAAAAASPNAAQGDQASDENSVASLGALSLRHLASIASRQGRQEDAAALLSRAAAAGGGKNATGDTVFQEAMAWLAAGKYDKAEETFARFLDADANTPKANDARAWRAVAMSRAGKHEDAVREFESLDAAFDAPDTAVTVKYELALALRALSRNDQAADAYAQVLAAEKAPPQLAAYSALDLAQLKSTTQNTGPTAESGTTASNEDATRKYAEALTLLDRCRAEMSSMDAAATAPLRERETYLRSVCLLKLGKPSEAAKLLATYANDFPKSDLAPAAGLALGNALLLSGKPREAAEKLQQVAESKAPADIASSALLKAGDAWGAAGQWTRSEEACTKFLDSYPDHARWFQARFGQGWARENQGRQDGAIEAYKDIVSRHEGITAARAQFQIGECLYAQKKLAEAVGELLKVDVLYDYPEWSAAALYEAGRCLTELKRVPEARQQFEDLVKRFPDTKWAALAKERMPATAATELPGRSLGGSR
jgi:TolA-binding protein